MLSRLWGHFGEPQIILFEGFIYNIKDKNTGLSFIASFEASGPIYLGEQENVDELEPAMESLMINKKTHKIKNRIRAGDLKLDFYLPFFYTVTLR